MKNIILFLLPLLFLSCSSESGYKLEVSDFKQKLESTPGALLIDVRKSEEYNYGHIRNAININWLEDGFFDMISTLDKSKPAFVYCLTGGRADPAADNMRKMGFKKVYELKGGILTWRKAGFPEDGAKEAEGMGSAVYDSVIKTGKTILVDFSARWCKPCQAMLPLVDEIMKEQGDKVVKLTVDVDKDHALVEAMGIGSIPTIRVYKDGKAIWEKVGVTTKEEIQKHLH